MMQGSRFEAEYTSNQLVFRDILLSHLDVTTDLSPRDVAKLVEICARSDEGQRENQKKCSKMDIFLL